MTSFLQHRLASIRTNANLSEAEKDERYKKAGHEAFPDYDPSEYLWGTEPPKSDVCSECYRWRRYEGQEHFGWAWWRVCDWHDCDHEHHQTEMWMATV